MELGIKERKLSKQDKELLAVVEPADEPLNSNSR
jgi:hypothetical protein